MVDVKSPANLAGLFVFVAHQLLVSGILPAYGSRLGTPAVRSLLFSSLLFSSLLFSSLLCSREKGGE
ncbi:TPA: hypothetical protein SIA39_004023 [Aeromonas sobria]|nr:hypothetical protein [Aeromonas sobria]